MRIGTLVDLPGDYSRFGRIRDEEGFSYSVDATQIPKGAKLDSEFAYKVDIWENGSGLAFGLEEE